MTPTALFNFLEFGSVDSILAEQLLCIIGLGHVTTMVVPMCQHIP
jgi:hypothetical protein